MANYCTENDCLLYGWQATASDDGALFDALVPRVSSQIDSYLGVPPGYFSASASATPAARTYPANGQDRLRVDPFKSITAVSVPSVFGLSNPTYLLENPESGQIKANGNKIEFFLRRTYQNGASIRPRSGDVVGWPDGAIVTVTGVWGWNAILPEIVEACVETVVSAWRSRDLAYSKSTYMEGQATQLVQPFTPRAKQILDSLKSSAMTMKFA